MSTRIAYLSVIIIWGTTPLAIKWSGEGPGYLFGVTARMVLGVFAAYLFLYFLRLKMVWTRDALKTYIVGGLGIYTSMSSVYWASQYIPSGWISVVFGLSPIITGIMAALILGEAALLPHKILGMLLGLAGLLVIFGEGIELGEELLYGVAGVLLGTIFHSLSGVLIKRLDARLSGFVSSAGGLSFAVPLFLLTWGLLDGDIPDDVPLKALAAIIYLGVVASTVGFALYYYILSNMEVSRVSLIALLTPLCALMLGNILNNEPLSALVLIGTSCIISGLVFYEYGAVFFRRLMRQG